MTGRQVMFGTLALLTLITVLNRAWCTGAADFAAVGLAVLITSPKYSPELVWQRWRRARARAHLAVLEGGKKRKRPESKYLN